MLSIGTVYPNLETLIELESITEFKRNSKNLYSIIKLTNVKGLKSSVEILRKSTTDYENDYGIILVDKTGKGKVYFISNTKIISIQENDITINTNFLGQTNGIFKIWRDHYENGIKEFNEWTKIKQSEKQAWLELALSFQNININNQKSIIEIDGNKIKSLDDFFCAIGEALNGKGGYFGRDLYGFFDCLRSPEFGAKNLKKVIWKNHKKCRWKLKKNFNHILSTLEEFKIQVFLQ